ncbi:MAG: hypothetical protein L3K08_05075 [Thermoplasmata archaeon]|nr:hypothetical protein [Thermoplasmata archaeon]
MGKRWTWVALVRLVGVIDPTLSLYHPVEVYAHVSFRVRPLGGAPP